MQQHDAVPEWLSDALLGYGDPSAAASGHYNIDADVDNATVVDTIDTFDTFLDAAHLREAFGERAVVFDSAATAASVAATVPDEQPAKKSKKASAAAAAAAAANSDARVRLRIACWCRATHLSRCAHQRTSRRCRSAWACATRCASQRARATRFCAACCLV
jgi:hypothetical protein